MFNSKFIVLSCITALMLSGCGSKADNKKEDVSSESVMSTEFSTETSTVAETAAAIQEKYWVEPDGWKSDDNGSYVRYSNDDLSVMWKYQADKSVLRYVNGEDEKFSYETDTKHVVDELTITVNEELFHVIVVAQDDAGIKSHFEYYAISDDESKYCKFSSYAGYELSESNIEDIFAVFLLGEDREIEIDKSYNPSVIVEKWWTDPAGWECTSQVDDFCDVYVDDARNYSASFYYKIPKDVRDYLSGVDEYFKYTPNPDNGFELESFDLEIHGETFHVFEWKTSVNIVEYKYYAMTEDGTKYVEISPNLVGLNRLTQSDISSVLNAFLPE